GVTLEESPAMAKALAGAGLDYLSVTDGIYESVTRCRDGMRREEGSKAYLWEAIKKAVDIPVLAGGGLRTPEHCEAVLSQGKADLIGLARPLLADPHWPDKAGSGRADDICLCISCFECTAPSPVGRQGARRCTVNAAVAREEEFSEIRPAEVKKRVMIAGGGPGGMEAARVAALRGHRVTLYEKGSELGGALLLAAAAPGKNRILSFRDYLEGQMRKLKVEVVLNTEVTAGLVDKLKPDVVVAATGSEPVMPDIPGVDRANAVSALDILGGKVNVSDKRVVVIGASATGCETAEYLAAGGNTVTVVKMRPGAGIASGMQPFNRTVLLEHLEAAGVSILLNREVVEVTDAGVRVRGREGSGSELLPADRVVVAVGARPSRRLQKSLESAGIEFYSIGDCEKPSIIKEAVYEGSLVGRRI
ncbi:MAG: FAD-dependent oxidoreductase, partial [Chloroflexota bacterium]